MGYGRFLSESKRTKAPGKGKLPGWMLQRMKKEADELKRWMDQVAFGLPKKEGK